MEQGKIRCIDLTLIDLLHRAEPMSTRRQLFKGRVKDKEVRVSVYDHSDLDITRASKTLEMLKQCSHHAINMFLAAFFDNQFFFVYELCVGDFCQILCKHELKPEQAVTYVLQLIDAVCFMHEKGLVHTDIRPSNCLLNSGGNLQLCNLELAMELDKECGFVKETRMLVEESIGYAPIEVSRDGIYSKKTDTFSIGATLYYFFKRRHLFKKIVSIPETCAEVEETIKSLTQTPQTKLIQRLHSDKCSLADVVANLVIYDPNRRPTCREVFNDSSIWEMTHKIKENLYEDNGWEVKLQTQPGETIEKAQNFLNPIISSDPQQETRKFMYADFYFLDESLKTSVCNVTSHTIGISSTLSSSPSPCRLDEIENKSLPPLIPPQPQIPKRPRRKLKNFYKTRPTFNKDGTLKITTVTQNLIIRKAKAAKVLNEGKGTRTYQKVSRRKQFVHDTLKMSLRGKKQQQDDNNEEFQELPPRIPKPRPRKTIQEGDKNTTPEKVDTGRGKRRVGEFYDSGGKRRIGQYYESGHIYGQSKLCAVKYFSNRKLNIQPPHDLSPDQSSIIKYNQDLKDAQIQYVIECIDRIYEDQVYEEWEKPKVILADPTLVGKLLSQRLALTLSSTTPSPFNHCTELVTLPSVAPEDGTYEGGQLSDLDNNYGMELSSSCFIAPHEMGSPSGEEELKSSTKEITRTSKRIRKSIKVDKPKDSPKKLNPIKVSKTIKRKRKQPIRYRLLDLPRKFHETGFKDICGKPLNEEWVRGKHTTLTIDDACSLIPGQPLTEEILDELLYLVTTDTNTKSGTAVAFSTSTSRMLMVKRDLSDTEGWLDTVFEDNKEAIEIIKQAINECKDYLFFPTIVSKQPTLHYILMVVNLNVHTIHVGDPCNPSGSIQDFEFSGQSEIKSAAEMDLNAEVSKEIRSNVKILRRILSRVQPDKWIEAPSSTSEFADVGLQPQRDNSSCGAIVVQIAELLIGREMYKSDAEKVLFEKWHTLYREGYGGLRIRLLYELLESYGKRTKATIKSTN